MNPRIFREYDIRGVADRDLPDALVRDIGRALGTYVKRRGEAHPDAPRIVLGRDCRLHSERLRDALLLGLRDTGVSVIDIGQVPSPLLYFAAHQLKTAGGVQVTGSHNPPSDNGFKLLCGSHHLAAAELHILRALIFAQDFERGEGSLHSLDLSTEYLLFIRERIALGPRRFRVVVDGGNGVGGEILVSLLRSLGFDVVPLYCEPDGRFPNHLPDPTVPEHLNDLRRAVAEHDAELGLALDGDADRLAAVDRQGRVLWGDQLMILFARAILGEQPGSSFVCEVKCSKALLDEIAARGGRATVWRVGRTLIHEKMRETGAALGGEMSGHLFFAHRYLGFDDAIYAAARLCELLSQSSETLAQMVDTLPRLHNTPELRVPVPEERKFDIASAVAAELRALPGVEVLELDGARAHWPDAWALVRASNTQPQLALRFEAQTAERLAEVQELVEGMLGRVLATLGGAAAPGARGAAAATPATSGGAAVTGVTPREVALYYDIGCPYSYLALRQLAGLRARTGAAVRLVPVLLGRLLAGSEGSRPGAAQLRAPWTSEARLRYLKLDLGRWARRLGVPLQFPSRYPMNTVTALRLCVQARRRSEAAHELLAQRLMRALWVEDGDLLDERTLRRLLQSVELPVDEFLAGCKLPEVAAALIDSTEQAVGRGVFGTPTFAIEPLGSPAPAAGLAAAEARGHGSAQTPRNGAAAPAAAVLDRVELFFGNDRIDFLEEALASGRA
jgi:phosphomannomutase/phosphoglucomutase